MKFKLIHLEFTTSPGGGWVLHFTRLMLISTQVEVVVEVGVELGNIIQKPQNNLQLVVS